MWMCLDCGKQFYLSTAEVGMVVCPYCGSQDVQEPAPCGSCGPCHVTPSVLSTFSPSTISDSMIIGNLEHYGVSWPDIFNLVWGINPMVLDVFSKEHRKVVADILLEQTKEEESDDPIEKKLHRIIAELLYVKYEKNINDYVEAAIKRMNAAHNTRRR